MSTINTYRGKTEKCIALFLITHIGKTMKRSLPKCDTVGWEINAVDNRYVYLGSALQNYYIT